MKTREVYSGLDWLKIVAAFFVVANHTGPLATYSKEADFLFIGLLSRVAVPIFFISTGFLLFRKFSDDRAHNRSVVRRYSKKIMMLYSVVILVFIPLNIYKGDFKQDFSMMSFIRDIWLDGTFYHLWFFPALLIGVHIVYLLYNKASQLPLLFATGLLFAVGLLGDSYYGLAVIDSALEPLYEGMFQWFDYTRNGLFFAPLFIAIGAVLTKRIEKTPNHLFYACMCVLSLGLLLIEGSWLKAEAYPRHESMYLAAIAASYFLFRWALTWQVKEVIVFRQWRVWIYIIHPLAIVVVRGASKAVHLDHIFITNSLFHYLAVALLSVAMSAVILRIPLLRKLTG
ncbi:hypothetical protein EBB07_21975 [Paenibacillaceae bacterium]|nr:hypothetical protein EBB07_21975 [Paenibacillaceae bacterium]